MNFKILLVSGKICSGKTTMSNYFREHFKFIQIKSIELLLRHPKAHAIPKERRSLQEFGMRLDKETSSEWILEGLMQFIEENPNVPGFVVDAVRMQEQIDIIRKKFGRRVVHVHLIAPQEELASRYLTREKAKIRELKSYEEASENPVEAAVDSLEEKADIVIDTFRTSIKDVPIPVSARLGLLSNPYERKVDVIIGGQYGSEGKGNICSFLAPEYKVLVRVGGPNAGHKVYKEPDPYTFHQLPSGTLNSPEAKLIIGPGAVINPKMALREIKDLNITKERLFIDAKSMVIEEKDLENEKELVRSIGSTGQGVGEASARKILGRSDSNTRLAGDIEELKPFITDTGELLEKCYREGLPILVEGTQGTGLSIHHGFYPYVTSRDTTVAGCLSEAGISPSRVRKIIMVVRTYPIRVESPSERTSGPLENEINWDMVAMRAGIDASELKEKEITSTTGKKRRVGEFDWQLFRKSCSLNAPTDIALTFVDYISGTNRAARRFDQLSPESIKFIEELENVARAPVSIISTRFAYRNIIDRRNWF
jgi:adenylosuccinate synthase